MGSVAVIGNTRGPHLSITALTKSCPGLGRIRLPPSEVGGGSYPVSASPGGRSAFVGWFQVWSPPTQEL